MAKCIHNIEDYSCGVCSKQGVIKAGPRLTQTEVLMFLNDEKVRATYGAVADCIGVIPQAMGDRLGDRTPEASWVVSAEDGRPTGYTDSEIHPELFRSKEIISSGGELNNRVVARRKTGLRNSR
jgi:hypothetical protein